MKKIIVYKLLASGIMTSPFSLPSDYNMERSLTFGFVYFGGTVLMHIVLLCRYLNYSSEIGGYALLASFFGVGFWTIEIGDSYYHKNKKYIIDTYHTLGVGTKFCMFVFQWAEFLWFCFSPTYCLK